jgi:hypothetical protein
MYVQLVNKCTVFARTWTLASATGLILSQIHPVYHLTPYFFNTHLNIIISHQNFVCISHLSHVCYVPTYHILLDVITLILFGEKYKL